MNPRFTVALVDDDPFIVASLATILAAEPDIDVVAQGSDGAQAAALFDEFRPDVLLMDIRMPDEDGLSAAESILRKHSEARIVLLTTFADDDYIVRALRLGARGYLIKQDVAMIAPALRSVMAGQNVLGKEVIGRMGKLVGASTASADETAPKGLASNAACEETAPHATVPLEDPGGNGEAFDAKANLTDRERAIVELVAQGFDNREIARRLYLGEGTVRNHVSAILQKLGLKNRTQIAIAYYRARRA